LPANKSTITGGFWGAKQSVNAQKAIFHQWEQLEASGCIDNFRILAEGQAGFRQGWFFADSDAYKWLEAAAVILPYNPDTRLAEKVETLISLIYKAQDTDGYLYTYNQIHFPGTRWVNLQIEHELYCHGHLIEAGVTHFECLGEDRLLAVARKAADCIVTDFMPMGPRHTPGHEEIEMALLRLYRVTGEQDTLAMARAFLERRGRSPWFAPALLREFISNNRRVRQVEAEKQVYQKAQPGQKVPPLPPENEAVKPPGIGLRFMWNALTGKFFQQHRPVDRQTVPVGHAVRFAYLETAAAMLDGMTGENRYLPAMSQAWDRMVQKRMYPTGGIGSLPVIEGFGRDYELDPETAYAETCAALGCLFWNREMSQLTGDARYSDLFEWQLYNAALVGMGQSGDAYFYNNPLSSGGAVQRRPWYEVPCCPSNLSRTFARLQEDILRYQPGEVRIEQYITSQHDIDGLKLAFSIDSGFPWQGIVRIRLQQAPRESLILKLRRPSWATEIRITLNGAPYEALHQEDPGGLNPAQAGWISIQRVWSEGDLLAVEFAMPVRFIRMDDRVRSCRGRAALACGPLVYCLESLDNPGVELFGVRLDSASLETRFVPALLGGVRVIGGRSTDGSPLTFIPYHLWGNRGPSLMKVLIAVVNMD